MKMMNMSLMAMINQGNRGGNINSNITGSRDNHRNNVSKKW